MLAFAHRALIDILTWLPMISVIITIHELGHFGVARACGISIERFSLGFGPTMVSWRDRAGTEWQIAWVLLGGYVRFAADENAASVPDAQGLEALRAQIIAAEGPGAERKYFAFKPLWQRASVVAAGPFANFALSIAIFSVLLGVFGQMVAPARVDQVLPGSAASRAGLRPGDLVVQAGGEAIHSFDDLAGYVAPRARVPVALGVERAGHRLDLLVTLDERLDSDPIMGKRRVGSLGIVGKPSAADYHRVRYNPVQAVVGGARQTWSILSTSAYYMGRMVTGQVSADQLGGPLRTAQLSGAVATAAARNVPDLPSKALAVVISLASLAAFISVSVGFLNLLPVPVLDGGHLIFYLYEAVARRPVGAAVQAAGYRVGLALLLGLMLFATTNDLQRSHVFHFLGGLFS